MIIHNDQFKTQIEVWCIFRNIHYDKSLGKLRRIPNSKPLIVKFSSLGWIITLQRIAL